MPHPGWPHLAELDLHEDVVLPATAPLRTPGVLGPVGAGAARRGAPGACEACSCPGKRNKGHADSGEAPFLIPSHPNRTFSLGQETLSWEVGGAREEEELIRPEGEDLAQGYQLLRVRTGPQPGPHLLGAPLPQLPPAPSPSHLCPGWGPKSRPP